jgi:RNA polymerase sigma factor (sigma-70 family)
MFSIFSVEASLMDVSSLTKIDTMNNQFSQSETTRELERVYFESYADLVSMARLLVDDLNSTSDVVQDAFARVLKAQPTFTNNDALFYMKRAVMNGAKSQLRKRQVSRKHLSVVSVEDTNTQATETNNNEDLPIDAQVIHEALGKLTQRQRECVVAFHTHKMSHKEIAQLLEISQGSVKTHLSRGLKNLSDALGGAK